MQEFVCNICGTANCAELSGFDRESSSCSACGSNIRVRGIIRVLSFELFGVALTLPEFPCVKSLRGIGMTDFGPYAERLAQKLDYRNTYYDRHPKLDICDPAPEDFGKYDFIISSEVIEHVADPAVALKNACRLLRPTGVLVLTVPYTVESSTREHFADLDQYSLVRVGQSMVLVNRTRRGQLQVFDNLTFHGSGEGLALEMRQFSEGSLREMIHQAGFQQVRIYAENDPAFGVVYAQSWSLPIGARKADLMLGVEPAREIMQEWAWLRRTSEAERRRSEALARSKWVRIGKKLGLV